MTCFFYNLFQPPSIKFWNIHTPIDRTIHNNDTYSYSIIKSYYHAWIDSKKSQLSQAIHSCVHFLQGWVNILFSVQFTVRHHTQVFICFYPLHCFSFNVDGFGTALIPPKVSTHLFSFRNIQIQVIYITPIYKVFEISSIEDIKYIYINKVLNRHSNSDLENNNLICTQNTPAYDEVHWCTIQLNLIAKISAVQ